MKPLAARELEARSRARVHHVRVREIVPTRHYVTHSQSQPQTLYHLIASRHGFSCSCPGYTYSGSCKHLGQLTRRAEREGWEMRIAPR